MSFTDYCYLTFNGVLLDSLIPGFKTLNVEGRQLFHPEYSSIKIPGRNGILIQEKTFPERVLRVHFILNGVNNKDALSKIQMLNLALQSKGDVKIQFGDEECFYYGQLSDHEDINYDFYRGVGSFDLLCQDPFKYMPIDQYTGTAITISASQYAEIKLDELIATPTSTNEVRITNLATAKLISLKNLDSLGSIRITHESITQSGQSIASKLDYSVSTWKEFKFRSGDNITISGATDVTLKVRRLLI